MSELPESWKHVDIERISEIVSGGTPSSTISEYYTEDHMKGIAWVTPADLSGYKRKYISHGNRSITEQGYKSCSAKLMPSGSVLFSSRAPIGYVAIAENEISTNQGFKSFVPDDGIESGYLYYYLKSIKHLAESLATGTTFKELSGKVAKTLSFPLAPQAEQTRIVEKLDEVLAQVDTIKARLDSIPTILKRFRQSVLAAAVSGRLTEDEFKPNAFLTLGETGIEIKTGPFGSALHKSDYIEAGISVINPMHINDGFIQPSTQMTITQEKFSSLSAWHLKNGDVVVGRRGEMGRAAVVRNIESRPLLCGTGSMILRGNENINPDYLCFIIRSPVAVSYFNSTSVGSTMVNLNQQVIKKLRVYFPSLSKQKEIVSLVNQYFAFADTIEAQVKKAQARVNNLTQSILAKALRGELVAQDPSDEPAEKLLERIAQARKEAEALAKAAKKVAKTK